ncbi:MAG: hypothetical protein H6841_07065 [Planctomycetes bacterium]|nr:hypothetical protein [Planctomycetota bacterium]MCB9935267.1 hypothetical protein [Planctomycetota bacterium]
MHTKLAPYWGWIGEWAGKGETLQGVPILMRMAVKPRLADQILDFEIQNLHAETGKLVHAVAGLMAVDPDGQRRMVVSSTIHGSMLMELTPEDPGAGAIEGISVTGNRVIVSLVEDDDGLMLTSYWKKNEPEAEQVGFTNVKLKRVTPA